ncbi:flagellar export chaperone FliS [Bacillus sp. Marseille-P3661]|uniref:flagellar export chaperone FliS n=1 Tax=Bacillus sp. Marseille-P3661 TaxID=1936234 RepID=UPI000C8254E0|nr:flagellar export chaperone FliS [Bacillus sp. Marseille-P3661]
MATRNPYANYKQTSVTTASPGELTLMLYNGCLKNITLAKKAIGQNDITARNLNSMKAQAIIKELMITLKTDNEIGTNLLRMYDYLLNRLIAANIQNDPQILDEVEGFVKELRDTWKEVMVLDVKQRYGQSKQV